MEVRKLSVYRGSTKDYVPVPKITIQGQWLESLGFSIGDKLVVFCEQDKKFPIEINRKMKEKEKVVKR